MFKRIKTFIAIALISVVPMLFPVAAHAALFDGSKGSVCEGLNISATKTNCDTKSTKKIDSTITNAINLLSAIIGIAAVIMIIVAGFKYITSGGDSNSVSSAKNTLMYAIIGLIVVAFAQTVVKFAISALA